MVTTETPTQELVKHVTHHVKHVLVGKVTAVPHATQDTYTKTLVLTPVPMDIMLMQIPDNVSSVWILA
jgi:hypothetical protein